MQRLLTDSLRRAETLFGDRTAVVDGPVSYDYATLAARARRLAGVLHAHGVGPGDRVGVLMDNGHRYLDCYYAVPGSGAVLVPLNNRCAAAEHRYLLTDAGVTLLIADDANAEMARGLADSVPTTLIGHPAYDAALAVASPMELGKGIGEHDLAALFYTGGTTGAAKGVQLSHANLCANALHVLIALGYTDADRYLHVAPMYHLADGASTYSLTWAGGSHVFLPRFLAPEVNAAIGDHGVTAVMLVPAMISAMLDDPSAASTDFSTLRLILHGAAPISTSFLRRAIEVMGCSFFQGYGMTEGAPFNTLLAHEELLLDDERLRSVGRAIIGVEVTVRSPDGSLCAPREVGEVVSRGPNFTSGYWNKPDETKAALRDGWYWTGDVGYLIEDGHLFLVDRAKDMIISGGENVYSIEVEDAVSTHPAVAEVAVIGVPDDRWGERVHAVVALRPGATLSEVELRDHCRELIAGYKRPRSLEIVAALPRSGPGKVLKQELRKPHWHDADRQIN